MFVRILRPFLKVTAALSVCWGLMAHAQETGLRSALDAADSGDWDTAIALLGPDSLTEEKLLTWLRLLDGAATFDEYVDFLEENPDWPGRFRVRLAAELTIPLDANPERVIAFFNEALPETGEGLVAFSDALNRTGQADRAREIILEGWQIHTLTETGHDAMLASFSDLLRPHHAKRTDALLWKWKTDAAERMMPLLSEDQQALARARIAFIKNAANIDETLEAVPAELRPNSGLQYDRFNWLADRGRREASIDILERYTASAEKLGQPFRWSGWRRSHARWLMREGQNQRAYRLASQHFLADGTAYSDLEWLAGYIALRKLDQPETALIHFENLRQNVTSPISVSRAEYWLARVHEQLGNAGAARTALENAANHQTAFYGLLASEEIGRPLEASLSAPAPTDVDLSLLNRPEVKAAFMLLAEGERGHAVTYFVHFGKTYSEADLVGLGHALDAIDESYFQVLLGKQAATRGIVIPHLYFPDHALSDKDIPVSSALAMSIARRESEFRVDAGSPVGALGLMQLMPATAEEVASNLDITFSRSRLTSDWDYNATLGAQYLADLEFEFGPSPVMIAAGYNAGPSRPNGWMDDRGDPRIGEIDVVDWIEHIPFRETRNYVMRVTESIPVYEARLSGISNPVRFTNLLIGEKPIIRPQMRPDVFPKPIEEIEEQAETGSIRAVEPAISAPVSPSGPAAPAGIRPIARPGG